MRRAEAPIIRRLEKVVIIIKVGTIVTRGTIGITGRAGITEIIGIREIPETIGIIEIIETGTIETTDNEDRTQRTLTDQGESTVDSPPYVKQQL